MYIGQGRKISDNGYWLSKEEYLIDHLCSDRVTNIDIDSIGQFLVGYLYEMRNASILVALVNRATDEWINDNEGEKRAYRAACEAIKILSEWD